LAGVASLGIRLFEGSTDRYHASLDRFYRDERTARSSEGGELLDAARRNWHGSLPPAPTDLLDRTTFALTTSEAEFLSERVRRSAPDSLLAASLSATVTRQRQARAPWDLGKLDALAPRLQEDIEDAQRYSLAMEGAVLLYNRMLAELSVERAISTDPGRVERFGQDLDRWADEMEGSLDGLRT